jgi:hypothetical protein
MGDDRGPIYRVGITRHDEWGIACSLVVMEKIAAPMIGGIDVGSQTARLAG